MNYSKIAEKYLKTYDGRQRPSMMTLGVSSGSSNCKLAILSENLLYLAVCIIFCALVTRESL